MTNRQNPVKSKPVRLFAHAQWEQCFQDFIRSLGNKSGSTGTPYIYGQTLRRFFADPHRTPDLYTRAEVEQFLHATTAGQRATGTAPKPATFNARLTQLRSFYTFAANYAVLFRGKLRPLFRDVNPLRGITLLHAETQQNRTLTVEMIERIFAVIPRDTIIGLRDRALCLAYFWTGRRRAELVRMRWADIEQDTVFDDGHRGVRYHWRGKGHSRQPDSAELPGPAWAAIRAYLEMAERWGKMQPSDPIFLSMDHRLKYKPPEPLKPSMVDTLFRRYLALAGIDSDHGRYSIHSWRHSAAFVRWQEKQDMAQLQEFLRHKNINTTMLYIEEWKRQPDSAVTALQAKYGHF